MSNFEYRLTEDEMEQLRTVANLALCIESIAIMPGELHARPDMSREQLLAMLDSLGGPVRQVMKSVEARGLVKSGSVLPVAGAPAGNGQADDASPEAGGDPAEDDSSASVTVDLASFQWLLRALQAAPTVLREGGFARNIGLQIAACANNGTEAGRLVAAQWREHIQPLLDAAPAAPMEPSQLAQQPHLTCRISEDGYNRIEDTLKLVEFVISLAGRGEDGRVDISNSSLIAFCSQVEDKLRAVLREAEFGHWVRVLEMSGAIDRLKERLHEQADADVDAMLGSIRGPVVEAVEGVRRAASTGGA